MLKLYPSNVFYIEVGPQVGFVIRHKEIVETYLFENTTEFEPKSIGWCMNLGVGF